MIYKLFSIFFEFTRRLGFWFIDFVRSSKIRIQYNNILKELTGLEKNRSDKLNRLLTHASKTTNFYKIYSGLELKEFPIIDKNSIKVNINSFLSTSYKENQRFKVVTSGSTGTPFTVYQNSEKKIRNLADTLYFSELGGYKLGYKLFYLKIWVKEKLRSNIHYFLQNIVPIDVLKLDDKKIKIIVDEISNSKGNVSFLGYVTAWETICKFLDKNDYPKLIKEVKSVITMSESLDYYTKTRMEYYYGVIPMSRYSNLENGIIAQQIMGSGPKYLINTASYIVEILNIENDLPAPSGKLGRIVVTDLFNYALPMIRYDTGDFGILSHESDKFGNQYLELVEGRKLDNIYNSEGHHISSYLMYRNMWKYTEIAQYQIIQTGFRQYIFKISLEKGTNFKKEKELTSEFLEYLGDNAEFKIEYVDEIPQLSSGKRRKVINLYYQN